MFFKNIIAYRFNREINFNADQLEQQLKEFAFVPCEPTEKQKFGWVEPAGKAGTMLTHVSGENILITAKHQVKLIPSDTIKTRLNEKIDKIEAVEGRPLKKQEKDNIKDEIIHDLLPQAFTRDTHTNVLILPELKMILVDASSHNKAEDVLALLRKTIGSLPVVPVVAKSAFSTVATEWVKTGEVPAGLDLLGKVQLSSVLQEGGVANLNHQDLTAEEVKAHIEADKMVTKLSIDWQERISFMMDENFTFKGLKWSDELKDQNDDIPREDQMARFDADMLLACGELTALLGQIYVPFDGVSEGVETGKKPNFNEMAEHVNLLEEARDYVVESGRATVAGLQRKFRIGYNQAYRLMECLETCGVVSEIRIDGGREVLVAKEGNDVSESN